MNVTAPSLARTVSIGNLAQRAYEHIQRNILVGSLPAGSVISEAAMARELGISRTPVGEAIRQLAKDGLVRQVPRYGTIVRSLDRRDLIEQYEMREALESYAAARAAERITSAPLARLEDYCDVMRGIGREAREAELAELNESMLHRFLAADMAFHMLVIEAAGNHRILDTVQAMRTISRIFRTPRSRHDATVVEHADASHRVILDALRRGDAEAARQAMGSHIAQSREQALQQMELRGAGQSALTPQLPDAILADLDLIEQRGRIDG